MAATPHKGIGTLLRESLEASAKTPQKSQSSGTLIANDPRPIVPASVEDTVLSERELYETLRAAQERKYNNLREQLYYWKQRNPPPITVVRLIRHYYALGRKLYPGYGYNSVTKTWLEEPFNLRHGNQWQVFITLCLYFAQDPRFEQRGAGYSLRKSILLQGNVGRGKTTLLRLFMDNPYKKYGVLPALKINKLYQKDGPKGIDYLQQWQPTALGIDDMGTEITVKWMGSEPETVLGNLILARYDLADVGVIGWNETHVTTNLPVFPLVWKAEEAGLPGPDYVGRKKVDSEGQELGSIELLYGNRVADRFKKMFNQIVVIGPKSLRK
jgi:hypothetical protein